MQFCGSFNDLFCFFGGTTSYEDCEFVDNKSNEKNNVEISEKPSPSFRRKHCNNSVDRFMFKRNRIANGSIPFRTRRCISKREGSLLNLFQNRHTVCKNGINKRAYDFECTDPSENILVLEQLYPTSTRSERHRFVNGRTLGRSIEKLDEYMSWRNETKLDDEEYISQQSKLVDDRDCWKFVVEFTAQRMGIDFKEDIAQIVRFGDASEEFRTLDGKRVGVMLAGLIDLDIAPKEFYSSCIVSYLNFKLNRESLETIVVLVDVRAGKNWKNTPALKLLPFVKLITKTLGSIMPERLDMCIVYPVPFAAKVIWLIVSSFLGEKQVEKIKIIWASSAAADTAAPVGEMKKCFDERTINLIETSRISDFITTLEE